MNIHTTNYQIPIFILVSSEIAASEGLSGLASRADLLEHSRILDKLFTVEYLHNISKDILGNISNGYRLEKKYFIIGQRATKPYFYLHA